ncbi:SEC-C domain-containing protein [Acinetobacter sp. ANC 3813]|uniref:SEC-C domain-containing protein n=1 Tax=Acinetobacter sp. ANC 3813 TaxID=1977873 RepID=UPI00111C377F|nr:SEC-C domain-containing protein [Acinetobacter sp. ANC 3813]
MAFQSKEWVYNFLGSRVVDLAVLKEATENNFLSKDFYNHIIQSLQRKKLHHRFISLQNFNEFAKTFSKAKPCWCLSGKKYIDCHFFKSNTAKTSDNELNSQQKKIFNEGQCLHRHIDKCSSSTSIQSHSISKRKSLSSIAKNNHVYGLKLEFRGKMSFKKMGLGQASTFAGFCEKHDNKLFESFEKNNFQKSRKQLFDLCYRALCIEHYHMKSVFNFFQYMKQHIDNQEDFDQQIERQISINCLIKFYKIGIKNSNNHKSELEKSFLEPKHEDHLTHYIFELHKGYPAFLGCTCFNMEFDLCGNRLQNLGNLSDLPRNIFINCVSFDGQGFFILSWFNKNNEYGNKILNSILKSKNSIEDNLFSLCFLYVQNTYVSPSWYENLTDFQKSDLEKMQMFWNDDDKFSIHLIKPNLDSIKVKNHYFLTSTTYK